MNSKEKSDISEIAKHVTILNNEVGRLQNDIKWIKRVMYYMGTIVSLGVGKIIFFT